MIELVERLRESIIIRELCQALLINPESHSKYLRPLTTLSQKFTFPQTCNVEVSTVDPLVCKFNNLRMHAMKEKLSKQLSITIKI